MFVILYLFLFKIVFTVFVSTQEILLQSDKFDVSTGFHENRKVNTVNNLRYEKYNLYHTYTSKHVFYWLYTRENTTGQLLNRSEPHMTETTTYDERNPLKVVVHGWLGTTKEKEGICTLHVESYLKFGNYNVLCVDWKKYSMDITYAVAKVRAKYIAKDIANVLNKITYTMTRGIENLHLIGHSMGAHIVGFTGKLLPNKIPRITGLDPARPMYENSNPADRLNVSDAIFVDVIHTNGDKNGIFQSLGDIDFYPNGGKRQPFCGNSDKTTGSCSHIKSYYYFAHSILNKEDYLAVECNSWENYNKNKCIDANSTYMGEHVNKNETGNFYLKVDKEDA